MTATKQRMFEPVDAASVAVYRIVFGALMLIATLRFFAHGWIAEYYQVPSHFFTYDGFAWVKPWPGVGMYIHFGVMAVLAVMIIVGLWSRFSVAAFGALFAYAHLIDKTNYLNHYFLVIWLCVLMAFLPIGAMWSIDARGKGSSTIPRWALWALRGQVALVYIFGGIAKLNYDWLVHAQPLDIWLAANTDFPVIGGALDQPWVAYVFSYAGVLFDLSIVPLLLWRRSRPFAYVAVIGFHLVTARLFNLGMFPWIMIGSSLLFLPPDWPRRFMCEKQPARVVVPRRSRAIVWALGVYFAFHVLFPLRGALYPGNATWTEEGFRFAWNVMVMEKDGSVELRVREPATGRRWEVLPTQYLTRYQAKMAASQPDMILQLAHIVADDFRARGVRDPEVRVDAFVSLNGRRRARLIDPEIDLAQRASLASAILPQPDQ
jgi:vitamin K-dependent gamma-carboxylase